MNRFLLQLSLLLLFSLTSCIREEALNSECDILEVDAQWLSSNGHKLVGKPIISNYSVELTVKEGVDYRLLEPQFVLSQGARIEKEDRITGNGESGIIKHYITYSADGKWSKSYKVFFYVGTLIEKDKVFGFENYSLDETGRYNVWFEMDEYGTQRNIWASGNAGFAFTGRGETASDFPTSASDGGVKGACVKLTTCDTGVFGEWAGKPIAAGNIFLGEFSSTDAMSNHLKATRFGVQMVSGKPVALKGYYKYKAGDVYTDGNKNEVPGMKDSCAIYTVLFEVDPNNFIPLKGDDVKTNERVVMIAELKNQVESDEWIEFEIPYELVEGKEFDYERLSNNAYAITLVASSSKGGDTFEGAIGSTLYVDEINIVWEDK